MAPTMSQEAIQFIENWGVDRRLTISQLEGTYIRFSLEELRTVPPFDLMRRVVVEVYLSDDDDNDRYEAVIRYLQR
jgi:hypothetical protein